MVLGSRERGRRAVDVLEALPQSKPDRTPNPEGRLKGYDSRPYRDQQRSHGWTGPCKVSKSSDSKKKLKMAGSSRKLACAGVCSRKKI